MTAQPADILIFRPDPGEAERARQHASVELARELMRRGANGWRIRRLLPDEIRAYAPGFYGEGWYDAHAHRPPFGRKLDGRLYPPPDMARPPDAPAPAEQKERLL